MGIAENVKPKLKTSPIWCADLITVVDPCAEAGAAVAADVAKTQAVGDATGAAAGSESSTTNDLWDADGRTLRLAGAADEVLDFQLVLEKSAGRLASVRLEGADDISLAVYQHVAVAIEGRFYDDALVPLGGPAGLTSEQITRKAPKVPSRRRQGFTVELAIGPNAAPGRRELALVVSAGGKETRLAVELTVYGFRLPDHSDCIADLNNYGRAPGADFDGVDADFDRYLAIERGFFQMAREHRALFHLLPYGQSGHVESGYAPTLTGRGRTRRVADWTPFDRHWGPYLDGSAFAETRGGVRPLESIYLPVCCDWPADFEKFGAPGFEHEFRTVLREMAAHFAERGWTATQFEVFFNHKVSWKYYPWDMDEIYYHRDDYATNYFARLAREATKDFPQVKFANRIDSSNVYAESARSEMADLIDLWVVNRGCHSESPDESVVLRSKGRQIWFYGGAGAITAANRLDNLRWPWLAWGRETDGFTWWNGLGYRSWEEVGNGFSHCFYPGARFGIEGPLASIRLKVLRRGMQDHAYLEMLSKRAGSRAAADAIIAGTIGARNREDWYQRQEGTEVDYDEIQSSSRTAKAWNTAAPAAWDAARAGLARAIEGK